MHVIRGSTGLQTHIIHIFIRCAEGGLNGSICDWGFSRQRNECRGARSLVVNTSLKAAV